MSIQKLQISPESNARRKVSVQERRSSALVREWDIENQSSGEMTKQQAPREMDSVSADNRSHLQSEVKKNDQHLEFANGFDKSLASTTLRPLTSEALKECERKRGIEERGVDDKSRETSSDDTTATCDPNNQNRRTTSTSKATLPTVSQRVDKTSEDGVAAAPDAPGASSRPQLSPSISPSKSITSHGGMVGGLASSLNRSHGRQQSNSLGGGGTLMWSARRIYDDVDEDDEADAFLNSSLAAPSSKGGVGGWRQSPGSMGLNSGKIGHYHSRTSSYQSYFAPYNNDLENRPTQIFEEREGECASRSRSPQQNPIGADEPIQILHFHKPPTKNEAPSKISYSMFNSTGRGSIQSPGVVSAKTLAPFVVSKASRPLSETDESSPTLVFRSGGAGGVLMAGSTSSYGTNTSRRATHNAGQHITAPRVQQSDWAVSPSSPSFASSSPGSYGSPTLLHMTIKIHHTRFESHGAATVESPTSPMKPPNRQDKITIREQQEQSFQRAASESKVPTTVPKNITNNRSKSIDPTKEDKDEKQTKLNSVQPATSSSHEEHSVLAFGQPGRAPSPAAANTKDEQYQYPTFLFGNGTSAEPTRQDVKQVIKTHKQLKRIAKEDRKRQEEEETLRKRQEKKKLKALKSSPLRRKKSAGSLAEVSVDKTHFEYQKHRNSEDNASNGQTRTDSPNKAQKLTHRSSSSST